MPQDDSRGGENPYMQSYNSNMAGYGYNAAIPGFNATAALAHVPTPLPIYQGWNQDPNPLPTYNAPQNSVSQNGYATPSYNTYTQQYSAVPSQPYQQNAQPQPAKSYDEGEVNEGNYDGGYATQNSAPLHYGAKSAAFPANDGNGFTDTAHRAVYSRSQDPPQNSRPGKPFLLQV
jgi:hypothetical protein